MGAVICIMKGCKLQGPAEHVRTKTASSSKTMFYLLTLLHFSETVVLAGNGTAPPSLAC